MVLREGAAAIYMLEQVEQVNSLLHIEISGLPWSEVPPSVAKEDVESISTFSFEVQRPPSSWKSEGTTQR